MMKTLSYLALAVCAFMLGRLSKRRSRQEEASEFQSYQGRALENEEGRIPLNAERLFALVFISGWLIAWTAGMSMALDAYLAQGSLFLLGWLIAASAGWVVAAFTIYRLLTGKPVKGRNGREI